MSERQQPQTSCSSPSSFIITKPHSQPLLLMIMLICIATPITCIGTSITDNTCTFNKDGKLFSLVYLNKAASTRYYQVTINGTVSIMFNFCQPFVPADCLLYYPQLTKAYSYSIIQHGANDPLPIHCIPYSSSAKTSNYDPQYVNNKGQITLNLTLYSDKDPLDNSIRSTDMILECEQSDDGSLKQISVSKLTENKLVIHGKTPFGCPVFQLSSIWVALSDNQLIFGVIIFILGFIMLFFGILMTHLMIFLAAYFLSFAVLTGIFTAFLGPESSTLAIYFSLLFILFLATLIAYGLTRLVNVSIFFIGAFFGFILAAIINSIFCKLFGVYSVWSLVVFQVLCTIPFGLLTFKYSQQVIVLSTSLVGSYMVVRPISWIFGGFPNQFTLSQMIQNGQLKTLPWTFFLYLIFIIAICILGALYQMLKIKRRTPHQAVQTNFITENVEEHIDRIREAVQKIIVKYAPDQKQQDYKKMQQMQNIKQKATPADQNQFDFVFEDVKKAKDRKSKEQVF